METNIAREVRDCLLAGEQKLTQYESLGLSKGLEVPVGGTPYSPSPHLGGFELFSRLPPFFLFLYYDSVLAESILPLLENIVRAAAGQGAFDHGRMWPARETNNASMPAPC